jgi:putative FmdB family regulatory protein
MPIYEFLCEACGQRFEGLVAAGTEAQACPRCGAERAGRVFSAQAVPFALVKTPREARKQERRNAKLRESTKADFSARRRQALKARAQKGAGGA